MVRSAHPFWNELRSVHDSGPDTADDERADDTSPTRTDVRSDDSPAPHACTRSVNGSPNHSGHTAAARPNCGPYDQGPGGKYLSTYYPNHAPATRSNSSASYSATTWTDLRTCNPAPSRSDRFPRNTAALRDDILSE